MNSEINFVNGSLRFTRDEAIFTKRDNNEKPNTRTNYTNWKDLNPEHREKAQEYTKCLFPVSEDHNYALEVLENLEARDFKLKYFVDGK